VEKQQGNSASFGFTPVYTLLNALLNSTDSSQAGD
jgi:hypothetical protein